MILQRILCVVIGYVFGLFQTGYIIGRSKKIDLRDYGSGNSGTTNAMRTMGRGYGVIVYLGDMLKAVVAILVTYLLFRSSCGEYTFLMALYTGIGVVLGHNFPFYMHFKGGKGIAASSGVILSMAFYDWKFAVMAICIFGIALLITRYVSFASLCMMVGLFIELLVWGQLGMIRNFYSGEKVESYIIVGIMVALSFFMHRENIDRLVHGTERKVGEKREEDQCQK